MGVFIAFLVLAPVGVNAQSVTCSCVLYLREVLGVQIHGNAIDIMPNETISDAKVGDVALMSYGRVGHAALITEVITVIDPPFTSSHIEGFVISESNFHSCQTSKRQVTLANVRGIYHPTA